jgi:hypothetical protein
MLARATFLARISIDEQTILFSIIFFSESAFSEPAVQLPDGSYVRIRKGESPQQAYSRALEMYPEAFGNVRVTV